MTRRDYQLIADVLSHSNTPVEVDTAFARALLADNPRFDPARFLHACGWQEDTATEMAQVIRESVKR